MNTTSYSTTAIFVSVGFPIDALHCVYLGVVKHLTLRWFERIQIQGGSLPAVIPPDMKRKLNARLARITPPHRISRACESMEDANGWKAHQWCMWLLYYSIPVLDGIITPEEMSNWSSLVYAIAILSQSCVSEGDMKVAQDNLELFCATLTDVYPNERESYPFNFHILRHLPDFVRKHGPLPNFSMDCFETFNGEAVGYAKGSKAVALQVAKGHCRRLIGDFMDAFPDCEQNSKSLQLRQPLNKWEPSLQFKEIIPLEDPDYFGVCILPNTGERISSVAYSKDGTKRNSDAVLLTTGRVLVVEVFVRSKSGSVYAAGVEYQLEKVSPFVHIFKLKESSRCRRLVHVPELMEAVMVVDREDATTFITKFLTAAESLRS